MKLPRTASSAIYSTSRSLGSQTFNGN